MIDSARLRLNRFKYGAMLTSAVAMVAFPSAGLTAVASAEKVWDIETYDNCMASGLAFYQRGEITLQELDAYHKVCCANSGGVWNAAKQDCQAPPGDTQGSRQLPGNVQFPSDLAAAPPLTTAPPRPIQVPSDVATVSAVS